MKKIIIIVFATIITTILSSLYFDRIFGLYNEILSWLNFRSNEGGYLRGIGTNIELLLNGYFGIFFRYKMFGTFSWIGVPLLIYFILKIRGKERWEIAIFVAISGAIAVIGFQGFMNYRYQLTVYPLIVTMIFIFGWRVAYKKNKKMVWIVVSAIIFFALINTYLSWEKYRYYYRAAIGSGVEGEKFPDKMVEYINKYVANSSVVLEVNQPLLYYYTPKNGRHYNIDYSRKLRKTGANIEEAYLILKNVLDIDYVLIRGNLNGILKDILVLGSRLICEDQGYKLYKINDKAENPTITDFVNEMPRFHNDFSYWAGPNLISVRDFNKAAFPIEILGKRGEFSAEKIKDGNVNAARIRLTKSNFNERSEIQFGYFINPKRLNLKLGGGDIVSLIARIRGQDKQHVELFIQDKTDYWSRETINQTVTEWEEILVSKRIRDGFTKICLGVYWKPGHPDNWIDVSSLKIYVQKANWPNDNEYRDLKIN